MATAFDLLLILGTLGTVWNLWESRQTRPEDPGVSLRPGVSVTIPGVQWGAASQHVVLFVYTACPACHRSSAFYKTLADELIRQNGKRFVVASPEPVPAVQAWLEARGIRADQVVQLSRPSAVGLSSTPTLLLVSGTGFLTDVLVGRLSDAEQLQFVGRITGQHERSMRKLPEVAATITEAQFAALGPVSLVDIRDRDAVSSVGPRANAVNIPIDELPARAPVELDRDRRIVLLCAGEPAAKCRQAYRIVHHELGFARVSVLVP